MGSGNNGSPPGGRRDRRAIVHRVCPCGRTAAPPRADPSVRSRSGSGSDHRRPHLRVGALESGSTHGQPGRLPVRGRSEPRPTRRPAKDRVTWWIADRMPALYRMLPAWRHCRLIPSIETAGGRLLDDGVDPEAVGQAAERVPDARLLVLRLKVAVEPEREHEVVERLIARAEERLHLGHGRLAVRDGAERVIQPANMCPSGRANANDSSIVDVHHHHAGQTVAGRSDWR